MIVDNGDEWKRADDECFFPFQEEFYDKGHHGKGSPAGRHRRNRRHKLRKQRLLNQIGKYIIVAYKDGKKLYLQDQRISNGGYWTQFQANARVFNTQAEAEKVNAYFHLGNPRVVLVEENPYKLTGKQLNAYMEQYRLTGISLDEYMKQQN